MNSFRLVVFYSDIVLVSFTHILQGAFTGTGAIIAPVPAKQPRRIWINPSL